MKLTTKDLLIIIASFLILVWGFRAFQAHAGEEYYNSDGTHSHTVTEGGDIIASDGTYQGRIEEDGSHISRDNTYEGHIEDDGSDTSLYIDKDGTSDYHKRDDTIYESNGEHAYEIH